MRAVPRAGLDQPTDISKLEHAQRRDETEPRGALQQELLLSIKENLLQFSTLQ